MNKKTKSSKAASLKQRFLSAILNGELGSVEDNGVVVTLKEFKAYFSDIKTQYIDSFLPAATIETGQNSVSHTKFVFRLRKGVYRVHEDALEAHRIFMRGDSGVKEKQGRYFVSMFI